MELALNVVILVVTADDATVQYMEKLSTLGFCVEKFDDANILIKDYSLPAGWNKKMTDLILHVPPDMATTIHGILIPKDLTSIDGREFAANAVEDNGYVSGWVLLSFRLQQDLHNEHFLQNHMELVGRVLAFRRVAK